MFGPGTALQEETFVYSVHLSSSVSTEGKKESKKGMQY